MTLELSIEPAPGRHLAGASLPVAVVLKNAGAGSAEVPQDDELPFEFVLQPQSPGGRAYSLSQVVVQTQRMMDPLPSARVQLSPLAAGATRRYEADLATLGVEPLRPGRYALSVAWARAGAPRLASAPVALELAAPVVRSFATAASPRHERFGQVVLESGGPQPRVLQRVAGEDRPADGPWHDVPGGAAPGAVQAVAAGLPSPGDTAPGGGPDDGTRWLGVLQQGPGGPALSAAIVQGAAVFRRIDPLPLGVAVADLAPVGWQARREQASFVALGKGADGRLRLVLAAFAVGGQSGVRAVPIDDVAGPARWAVRFHGAGAPLKLDLVTVESRAGRWRVVQRVVDFSSGQAAAPVVLDEDAAPVVALALDPLKGLGGPDAVDVLAGLAGPPAQLRLRRLALAGGAPVAEGRFALPVDAAGRPAQDWQLSPPAHPRRVAVARLGDQLIGRALGPGGVAAQIVDAAAPQATLLQLRAIGSGLWATWIDPALGLRFAAVP
ncbi:hypothetical protein [Piscinibacter sakaiensis]|uniref:Uncharacterized protein n=1 Tax=Piscinibacter sakaiensis TaxID=1547922 RepID=A0A0K8NTU6_PISS1|nr:hypothetical protein [Piscinibacter sakaiensis]GAP33841.1 hypothetical protein ISF6_1096 [Piscinibacter sakaiensis]